MLSPVQQSALTQAASASVSCEQTTGLPAELTLAQWALESKWGLHQPGNNCFGIKAYSGCFGVQPLETVEIVAGVRVSMIQNFAAFPSLEACFDKHANLLAGGKLYLSPWTQYLKTKDLDSLIRQVASIYATDPNYSKILLQIIAMPEVQAALAKARANEQKPADGEKAA